MLDAYSLRLGCSGGWGGGCDLEAVVPIPADWITAIHVEGYGRFEALGRGYPESFVAGSR